MVKGSKKSEDQKSAINNIDTLFYKSREKVIKFFNDYSKIYLTLNIKRNMEKV